LVCKFATTAGAASASAANASLVGAKTVIPCVSLRGETRSALITKSTRAENVSLLLIATSTTVCGSARATESGATDWGIKSPSILWTIPLFVRLSAVTMFLPLTCAASPLKENVSFSPWIVVSSRPSSISAAEKTPRTIW